MVTKRGAEAVKAAVAAQGPDLPPAVNPNVKSFDIIKESLIIDFRSVLQLPFDTEADGIKALRAIVFSRGTGTHYPDDPSKLMVMGTYRKQSAFCLVHFETARVREPELLISFVDYGMVNRSRSGIAVETLALPLKKSKNTYNTDINVTLMKEVIGFEPIDCGKAPWSMSLKPALDQIAQFKRTAVCSEKSMQSYINADLELKLKDCYKWALEDIDEEVKAIARQDESQGSKQKAVFVSKLDALFAEIQKWPISNFNHSLDKRITCVDPDTETAKPKMPEWMSNSVMRQLCTKKHIYEPRRLLPRCISFLRCVLRINPHAPGHRSFCLGMRCPAGLQGSKLELEPDSLCAS